MMRDLICTQVILRSYGEARLGLPIQAATSHIIVYYGAENFGPFTLTRDRLDDHFGVPLVGQVEEVNAYYRDQVERLLNVPPPDVDGMLAEIVIPRD
jgi:hypothetical protein